MKYLLPILLLTSVSQAQTVSISTKSFQAWGSERGMISASIGYQDVQFHYFNKYPFNYYGLSYTPINIKDIVKIGIIVFGKKFLFGTRINALVDIGYNFSFGRISYRHISNANFGEHNWGVDHIVFTVNI